MKTELKQNKEVVIQGLVSLRKDNSSVFSSISGKLYLTNQRLIFEAGKMNIFNRNKIVEINLSDIQSIKILKRNLIRFLIFMFIPYTLVLYTKTGQGYRLTFSVISKPSIDSWVAAIEGQAGMPVKIK